MMELRLAFIFVLWAPLCVIGEGMYHENEISYYDILNLNISCYPKDSCNLERQTDSPGIQFSYSCSCDPRCSQFGTCCIDSSYRDNSPPMQECRIVDETIPYLGYYMVHRCPNNVSGNLIWKSLCENEWNGEDDIMKLAPVTSLDTSTTYKNYYCFRCQETRNKFLYWNLFVQGTDGNSETREENRDFSVTYNQDNKTWVAALSEGTIPIAVQLAFQVPEEIRSLPIMCDAQTISDCPDTWTDESTRNKCVAYTAIVYPKNHAFRRYKNAHCALCNFEYFNNIACEQTIFGGMGGKEIFSFSHLLDINRSDGDKVGKVEECEENYLWDPYGKKCRKLACALPGHVVKDGRCTSS